MLFNSIFFICFFLPAVLIGYWILPQKIRLYWLLFASLVFYFSGGREYLLLLVAVAAIDYVFGMLIHRLSSKEGLCKAALVVAVAANISILGYYKYIGFIEENLNKYLHLKLEVKSPYLPIGISFFVFQGLSYVIDVYRGVRTKREGRELTGRLDGCEVQKNFFKLLFYISLFPQLIAGPIVRYSDVEKRIDHPELNPYNAAKGFERFAIGLAKKVILADTLAAVCDPIFDLPFDMRTSEVAWIGAIFYAFQICLDFSGYSDMAIGIGRMLGFEFPENFDRPYQSRSITEFWRRWHMSLSSWFRDYVYIPLGGNRKGNVYLHLLIVFALTGLWHGASWNFVMWGLTYGVIIVIERFFKKHVNIKVPDSSLIRGICSLVSWVYATAVVGFEWVLFRCESFHDALDYYKTMLGFSTCRFSPYRVRWYLNNMNLFILLVAILVTIIPWRTLASLFSARNTKSEHEEAGGTKPELQSSGEAGHFALVKDVVIKICTAALLVLCLIYVMNSTYSPFIYFQF